MPQAMPAVCRRINMQKENIKTPKKILLTGFEAFNGRTLNPSQLIVERINAPEGVHLIKRILPVEFDRTTKILKEIVETEKPDIILSLGQAGNSPYIHVERVAINMDNGMNSEGTAVLPDSAGTEKIDVVICKEGENAYFSTLPVWELIRKVNEAGVGCRASYSAGTYVCNHVMYVCAYLASQNENMISGFVHVPFLPEQLQGQMEQNNRYSMELDDMVKGVQVIIDYLAGI